MNYLYAFTKGNHTYGIELRIAEQLKNSFENSKLKITVEDVLKKPNKAKDWKFSLRAKLLKDKKFSYFRENGLRYEADEYTIAEVLKLVTSEELEMAFKSACEIVMPSIKDMEYFESLLQMQGD